MKKIAKTIEKSDENSEQGIENVNIATKKLVKATETANRATKIKKCIKNVNK